MDSEILALDLEMFVDLDLSWITPLASENKEITLGSFLSFDEFQDDSSFSYLSIVFLPFDL